MTTHALVTALIALALVIFIAYRLVARQPVTQRTLLMPFILAVALAGVFVAHGPAADTVVFSAVGTALGIGSGLVSGQFMRVWREETTSTVYQQGSGKYLIAVAVLIVVRVLARVALSQMGSVVDEATLNDAFIAVIAGNYLGRTIIIALRTRPLVSGNLQALPTR